MKRLLLLLALISAQAMASDAPLPTNPGVTQSNISETICHWGYTKSIRPAWQYTNAIKSSLLVESGHALFEKHNFILDHRLPLELGGAPADPSNMQLQTIEESEAKDEIESCLNAAVCIGNLGLREAQKAIWRDWRAAAVLCGG